MDKMGIRRTLCFIVGVDAALVLACYYLAYLFRFEFDVTKGSLEAFQQSWYYIIPIKISAFAFFNLYRGMWRYTGLVDLINVVKAVVTSSFFIILAVLILYRFEGYPRSIFIIDAALTIIAIGGIRVAIRLYFTKGTGVEVFPGIHRGKHEGRNLLIIGAGDAGEKVLREIHDNPGLKLHTVGFLDDNPGKQGRTIHGVPVLGTVGEIDSINVEFDEILIAIPSAKGEEMRRIVSTCDRTGKRYRTVPGIGELINGKVSVKTIREVTLVDLLGRAEVHLDQKEIDRYLKKKRILITGAGGSIGSELVRQICRFDPEAVGLLDVSELNLFRVEMECRHRFEHVKTIGFLADVRRREALSKIFQEFHPEVVFHTAAYKHVPIQEISPWEAVYNNVLGTRNLMEVSLDGEVERFVLVSTDKAVKPANVMGATKRIAEMLVECVNGELNAKMMAVRFGNVIGSSGSAIPIFQEQIARGGPLTVTHPEATRYFMSIPEASQLILQAGAMGKGGEIFILDMGEPVRIIEMARDLIRLSGFEPERDIPIEFIGLRPGEKLFEELITEGEGIVSTTHDKIMVLRGNNHRDQKELHCQIDELLSIARKYDVPEIKRKLQQLVPDYTPQF